MRLIKYIVLFALLAGAGWLIWLKSKEQAVDVSVTAVEKGVVEATVANTRAGTVEACRRARLSPSLGGQISALPFPEGAKVNKDNILMELWSKDAQADIILAAEQIVAAQKDQEVVCEQAAEAARQAARIRQLAKTRTVSAADADEAKANQQIAQLRCDASENQVSVARSRLRLVETHLEKTVLRAPFDGVIAKINGELNEYVTPSPPGIQTTPVIDLIEPGCFKMSAPIDEVDAAKISVGLPARITLDAWRDRAFDGTVKRIGDYIVDLEKQARTVEVELEFANQTDLIDLRVGYSADVDIIIESNVDALRIPSEALLDSENVLRFDESSQRLQQVTIKQGIGNWRYVEVLDGLSEGDQVVTSLGVEGVEDGALATVKPPAAE